MQVLTVCGMGFGTSLMLLMEIQDIGKKYGYKIDGEAVDLSSAKGRTADLVIASSEIANELSDLESEIVPIVNLLDKNEIEEKVLPYIKEYFEQGANDD